eukprot:1330753-Alexandrium_andersonii.AAC.1
MSMPGTHRMAVRLYLNASRQAGAYVYVPTCNYTRFGIDDNASCVSSRSRANRRNLLRICHRDNDRTASASIA